MQIGDLVCYTPSLPEQVLGIIVGTHMTADAYGYSMRLWHVLWIGEYGNHTHEQQQYLMVLNEKG